MIPNITEEVYFETAIDKIFQPILNKKIMLWGISKRTELFLEHCPEHNVIGLLDSTRTGQYYYGKKILSLEEIKKEEVEIIIILAKEESTKEIYKNIYDFCLKNGIEIINRFGRNLVSIYGQSFQEKIENNYFSLSEESIGEKINENQYITFGLWDTLITSKCLKLDDFEKISEKNVLNTLVIRKKILDILKYCIQSQKKVRILEDSPLKKEQIKTILESHIINIDDYLLPLTNLKNKENGLYIGTKNIENMFEDSVIIKNVLDMLKISSYKEIIEETSNFNERSLIALFATKIFNNPFALYNTDGKPKVSKCYDLGYLFIAPLFTGFIIWLASIIEKNMYDGILFGARDGYLFQQLYAIIAKKLKMEKKCKSIYFKTSRKLCINAGMKNAKELEGTAQHPYTHSPDFMLQNKYNVEANDIDIYDPNKYTNIISYVLAHKKNILEASENTKIKYLKYMEKLGILTGEKYLFFDLCSCGTCQHFLNNIIPFDIEGAYLCFYRSDEHMRKDWKQKLNIKSYYENGYHFDYTSNMFLDYCFMETVATSFEPSITGIDNDGKFIYGKEMRNEEDFQFIRDIQSGILDFADDYINNLYMEEEQIDKLIPDRIFSFKKQEYTEEKCTALDSLYVDDEWVKTMTPILRR